MPGVEGVQKAGREGRLCTLQHSWQECCDVTSQGHWEFFLGFWASMGVIITLLLVGSLALTAILPDAHIF